MSRVSRFFRLSLTISPHVAVGLYANRTPDMISELIVNTQTQIRAFCRLYWRLLAVFSPNHFRYVVLRRVQVEVKLTTGLRPLEFLSVARIHRFTSYTVAFHTFPHYTHRSFATQPLQVMRGRPSSQSLYRSGSCPLVGRPSTVNCCSCSSPQAQLQPSQTLEAFFMCFHLPPGIPYLPTHSQSSTGYASSPCVCSSSSSPLFETQITSSRSKAESIQAIPPRLTNSPAELRWTTSRGCGGDPG